jgi:sulfoquinovosidase
VRLAALVAALVLSVACSDPPPPVEVSAGRLTARIYPEPARIALLVDGTEVWTTRGDGTGGDGPPDGFAAIGTRSTTIEMQFGSFRFTENKNNETWQSIVGLANITETATGATFTLKGSDRDLGTGTLTFVTATRSGPDPDAAGYPRHVRIELTTPNAQRFALATPCDAKEHFVGLGGQSMDIDHHGETVPLWVQEDGIGKYPDPDDQYLGVWFLSGRKHSTHTPMPMLLSSRGYALAVDTDARAIFDLCDSHESSARYETWSNKLDVQVFVGDAGGGNAPADAFGHMIAWAGKPARPPELIFAPWIDALFGSANVRRVANALRTAGVSSSVIWTEDWRGGGNSSTGYALHEDWKVDRALYPDFEALASDLHGMGFAFHTYHNTFIDQTADIYTEAVAGGYPIENADGTSYSFTGVKFTPSTLLDLTNPQAVSWAKDVMTQAITLGADGWMADFAEWLPTDATLFSGEDPMIAHNRYTVDWARMNKEMFATTPPGRPPGIYFMRSAWLHSQPEVQVMWAGDQQTDFSDGDGFPSVIPIGLGMGLAGFPYFGHDIGGYMSQGTVSTSEELFFRWTTMGALSPVMRTHHGRNVTTNVQWETNAATIAHFAKWSRFHMQLAAYFNGSIGSFERDGLPLFRFIPLEFPGDDWAWTAIDQYMLGDRILVAPILQEGATTREVRLPGTYPWYPLFGGAYIDHPLADNTITATASRDEIPAYVPMGSILVLYPNGVDTVLPAPAMSSAMTLAETNNAREVWLFSGTAFNPAHARWNDTEGPVGTPNWTWTGRTPGPLPTSATFNGSAVTVTTVANTATVTVSGNGMLEFAGGGTLTIARGGTAGQTVVRLR